jgi:FkbM family methyltransferase
LPNREEWAGHSSRAGEPLVHVVRSYVNSEEFKARKLLEIALPPGIVRRHNGRFFVFADQADPVLGAPALMGVYEPHVSAAIEALLQPGDHFLDVGANLGYFSLLAAARVGDSGRIYSVEPNELNVKLLESSRRANKFKNIFVMQVGASQTIETLFLHATVGNGSTSAVVDEDSLFSARTTPGVPLDNLLAHRSRPIRLIKVDVEGFEYNSLLGAQRILSEDNPDIIFEFQGSGHVGITGKDFLRWLEGHGYSFINISGQRPIADTQTVEELLSDFHENMIDHLDVLAKHSRRWR